MQLISLSKLNNACGSSFRRAVIRSVESREKTDFTAHLCPKGSSLRCCYSSNQLNKFTAINPSSSSFCCVRERKSMAVSVPKAFSGNRYVDGLMTGFGNVGDFTKAAAVFFVDKSGFSWKRASVSLRNHEGGVMAQKGRDSRMLFGPFSRHYHVSSSASNGGGATAVPFEVSVKDEKQENSADSSDCKQIGSRTLKLKSGSCYLPHPEKVETGGEDAHFICEEQQAIGVADGVGGWAEVGVDAGFYSRLLMSNSESAIKEEPSGSVDPAKVLEKAYANTTVIGSSTACIIALTDQGINAINLGDSAFLVIRNGNTVFRSPVQQYSFNFPYQLGFGNNGDVPSSGQVFAFPVTSGDVLVAGTDGLFDNMFDNEIADLVVQAMKTGLEPQLTAQKIANLAQEIAQDAQRKTPFSAGAHDAGFQYLGGKLDDITVVVSYITADN